MPQLTPDQVCTVRLFANRLVDPASGNTGTVAQVVQAVCGVQAQEVPAAALAVRVRSSGLTVLDVDRARQESRSIVRTWCLRGTLHLIAAQDFGWLVALLGPDQLAGSLRRLAQMGLEGDTVDRAVKAIRDLLGDRGPLTRVEIARGLEQRSAIVAEGQARIHLIYQAAMRGIVCQGPDRDGEPAYLLTADWIGKTDSLPREQALAQLALRYITAYAPADPQGFASWSGLRLRAARQAWEQIGDRLVEVECEGTRLWMLPPQTEWLADQPAPRVRLLPRYDTYLLGYANRDLQLAPENARRVNAGGGIIHPVLLVDGFARGTWKTQKRGRKLQVGVEPFVSLEDSLLPQIQAEVADIGRFLGAEAYAVLSS
jgi:hypothetical protein